MARIKRITAIAVVAAILFGALSGCAQKQPEKSWTEEEITGFFSTPTVGHPGDNFVGGIESNYTLFRNLESLESNYDRPSYYLFESAQEAKRVFDEYASKAKENGWTSDGNMLSLSREGEYDGEVRRAFDCLYLSGNLIIMFDYTYAGDDEELVSMYNETIEEMPEWIKTTF